MYMVLSTCVLWLNGSIDSGWKCLQNSNTRDPGKPLTSPSVHQNLADSGTQPSWPDKHTHSSAAATCWYQSTSQKDTLSAATSHQVSLSAIQILLATVAAATHSCVPTAAVCQLLLWARCMAVTCCHCNLAAAECTQRPLHEYISADSQCKLDRHYKLLSARCAHTILQPACMTPARVAITSVRRAPRPLQNGRRKCLACSSFNCRRSSGLCCRLPLAVEEGRGCRHAHRASYCVAQCHWQQVADQELLHADVRTQSHAEWDEEHIGNAAARETSTAQKQDARCSGRCTQVSQQAIVTQGRVGLIWVLAQSDDCVSRTGKRMLASAPSAMPNGTSNMLAMLRQYITAGEQEKR